MCKCLFVKACDQAWMEIDNERLEHGVEYNCSDAWVSFTGNITTVECKSLSCHFDEHNASFYISCKSDTGAYNT